METASGKTILIVEDERDVVDLLTLSLRKAGGFIVATAADGVSGLQKARTEKPDFLILDLMLPKMPGLEICKILKSDPATRPRGQVAPRRRHAAQGPPAAARLSHRFVGRPAGPGLRSADAGGGPPPLSSGRSP